MRTFVWQMSEYHTVIGREKVVEIACEDCSGICMYDSNL